MKLQTLSVGIQRVIGVKEINFEGQLRQDVVDEFAADRNSCFTNRLGQVGGSANMSHSHSRLGTDYMS